MTTEHPIPAPDADAAPEANAQPEGHHVPEWAIVLTIGEVDVEAYRQDCSQLVALEVDAPEVDAVAAAISAAGLGPADLRAKALLAVTDADADRKMVLAVYSALCGFAGRRLDVMVGPDLLELSEFDRVLRSASDAGRPSVIPDIVQVGGPDRDDVTRVDVTGGFTPENLSLIRFARRLRLVPADSTALTLTHLVAITAVRGRAGMERFPYLSDGTEPAVVADGEVPGIDLHALRRSGEDLRRQLRGDTRDAVADFVNPSPRSRAFVEAAAVDLDTVLGLLGSLPRVIEVPERGDDGALTGNMVEVEAWHCPKPQNHTNGDASPSARLLEGRDGKPGFRCFRCLPERVDALRLVMWARDCSVDEAADWIVARVSRV